MQKIFSLYPTQSSVLACRPFTIALLLMRLPLFIAVFGFLLTASACAGQYKSAENKEPPAAATALRPYLGKWRPTSYSEGLNIGSLTISVDGLSYEVGGASVSYEVVRQTEEGVILRVTGRKPIDDPRAAKAMVFSLETKTITNIAPGGTTTTRQILWIYSCSSVDSSAAGLAKASCGKNAYMR